MYLIVVFQTCFLHMFSGVIDVLVWSKKIYFSASLPLSLSDERNRMYGEAAGTRSKVRNFKAVYGSKTSRWEG